MTTEELEQLLNQQPAGVLHKLAKGRLRRHFRLGKRRLVEGLLKLPPAERTGVESDLHILTQTPRVHPSGEKSSRPASRTGKSRHKDQPRAAIVRKEDEGEEPPVDLTAFLKGIGVPSPKPFIPDAWQEEALRQLELTDVIVSVPTGSGKTYVAIEATRRAMQEDRTVIYTSPLKALSNTKFTECSKIFGADNVGILTGDRRDNPHAPLLIMTTEILRNLLYDAASGEIDLRLDTLGLVIMDEFQFLSDPERGVVWEETLIFCPAQARVLLLSASIGNPEDVAAWLTSIRPFPCHLIRHHRRTVPLRAGYLHPNGKLVPLFRSLGTPAPGAALHPEVKRLFTQYENDTFQPRAHRG